MKPQDVVKHDVSVCLNVYQFVHSYILQIFTLAKLRHSDDWNRESGSGGQTISGPPPSMSGGLVRNGSHRRSTYRSYRGPWRGPAAEDDGPTEPLFHYPHSKQYYVQQQRIRQANEAEEGGGGQSPLDYDYSLGLDPLDRPSRSPSPHPTVSNLE